MEFEFKRTLDTQKVADSIFKEYVKENYYEDIVTCEFVYEKLVDDKIEEMYDLDIMKDVDSTERTMIYRNVFIDLLGCREKYLRQFLDIAYDDIITAYKLH